MKEKKSIHTSLREGKIKNKLARTTPSSPLPPPNSRNPLSLELHIY